MCAASRIMFGYYGFCSHSCLCDRRCIFSFLPHAVSEGDITVTGKVVDDAGEPLIGVSIQVKGTSKGATTDVNGIYTLNIASGSTLVFSYIGMKTIQRKVTKGGKLDITMENDENMLDEVVAVGYGSMKRSDLTDRSFPSMPSP